MLRGPTEQTPVRCAPLLAPNADIESFIDSYTIFVPHVIAPLLSEAPFITVRSKFEARAPRPTASAAASMMETHAQIRGLLVVGQVTALDTRTSISFYMKYDYKYIYILYGK